MKFLEGLLPIIPEKEGLRPITLKNKESIQAQLNEEARLERLARMSVNKDPKQLALEPIAHSLFDVFDLGTEKDSVQESSTSELLKLIPMNGLSVLRDTDNLDKNRVLAQIDIKAYQERRLQASLPVTITHTSGTQPDEDGDITMAEPPSEEEYLPNTQDVNQMIESILGPGSAMEGVVQTNDDSVSLAQPEVPLPLAQTTPNQTEPVVPEPTTTEPTVVQPAILTPFKEITLRNQSAPAQTSAPVQPAAPAQTTTPVQPAVPVQTTAPVQTTTPVQTTPTQTTTPVQTTPAQTTTPVHPTPVLSAQPTTVVAPAETVPETPSSEQSQDEDTMTEKSSAHQWFSDDMITTKDKTDKEKIYGYEPEMIPIFATLDQQDQCEKVTRASQMTMGSSNFDKPINVLNFSSNLELSVEKLWTQSGKLMFLKSLLKGLLGKDVIVLLVAHDLGEEETLVNLLGEDLKLDCVRMNYLLADDWNGEYGVFVKTMLKVDQSKESAKRGNDFSRSADLIICMDIRINRNNELFGKITKRNNETTIPSPVTWLVTLGSVEQRVFEYLKKNDTQYSGSKTPDLKELLRMADDWPVDETKSTAELNAMVAENVQAWLLSPGKIGSYQYRSIVQLPKSIHYGNLLKNTITKSTEDEVVTSDMDITSDSEVLDQPAAELSENLVKYVNEILFPPFDIKKGHLSKPNPSTVQLSGKKEKYFLKKNPTFLLIGGV